MSATGLAASPLPGNTHVPNMKALRAQFAQKDGEWFNATLFGKGLEQLRKAYGRWATSTWSETPVPQDR